MNKKGFTLVELVVAIAALALCSGIIMSAYFTSDELSSDADMYDEAMNQVSYIAETFKASTDVENFADNLHFEYEQSDEYEWTIYYNDSWYVEDGPENSCLMLNISLKPDAEYDSGTLYKLNLYFYKIDGDTYENIISVTSKKYYAGGAR